LAFIVDAVADVVREALHRDNGEARKMLEQLKAWR